MDAIVGERIIGRVDPSEPEHLAFQPKLRAVRRKVQHQASLNERGSDEVSRGLNEL